MTEQIPTEQTPNEQTADKRTPTRPAGHPGESTTVLVADDHPLWLDALTRDLEAAGLRVVAMAADGPSAVRRARATVPDVLALDLNLPGLRGDEVCAAIADLPTRTLVLSASGEEQDVLDAMKAGATGYLVKSASSADIAGAVLATSRGGPSSLRASPVWCWASTRGSRHSLPAMPNRRGRFPS